MTDPVGPRVTGCVVASIIHYMSPGLL